jgi:hypothetical protein
MQVKHSRKPLFDRYSIEVNQQINRNFTDKAARNKDERDYT